jgi:steroid delta-isomerase-like uncharacterized protein
VDALEENKRLVRRVYEEFTNQRRFDLAPELFGPDFVDHGAPAELVGPAGVAEFLRRFATAFPDFQFAIEAIVAEGDLVHVRGTVSGTQRGPYAGLPATGKHAVWSAMDDFRIEGGKVVERWTERNRVSLMRQLSAPPG